jgi:hypothetical protein
VSFGPSSTEGSSSGAPLEPAGLFGKLPGLVDPGCPLCGLVDEPVVVVVVVDLD